MAGKAREFKEFLDTWGELLPCLPSGCWLVAPGRWEDKKGSIQGLMVWLGIFPSP